MVTFSFNLMAKVCVIAPLLYLLFSLEKKAVLISYQSRSIVRPSVRASVMFLVNVSPPKLLDLATLYLDKSQDVERTGQHFM